MGESTRTGRGAWEEVRVAEDVVAASILSHVRVCCPLVLPLLPLQPLLPLLLVLVLAHIYAASAPSGR